MKFKFNFLKIKEIFSKTIWTLGKKAFLVILLFVLLDLIFGAFIFYKYVYLAELKKGDISGEVLRFDNKKYEKVLEKISVKESKKLQEDIKTIEIIEEKEELE